MFKIAIVGLGYWGTNILRNFYALESIQEVLVFDLNREKMNQIKNDFPNVTVAKSFENILESDAKAVVVATSPLSTHYRLGKLVLNAGKHLWLEKPLAASVVEVNGLIETANSQNVKLHVDHTFCYSNPVNGIKAILDSKELGRIKHVSMTRANVLPPKTSEDVFWDLAYHDLYLLSYWFGDEFYLKEYRGQSILKSGFKDDGHIFLESSLGMTADLRASFVGLQKVRQIFIVGDKKILFYNDLDQAAAVNMYDPIAKSFDAKPELNDNQEPLLTEAEYFVKCVSQNIESKTNGVAALKTIKLLELIS